MKAFFNRAPLSPNTRTNLSLGKIKPEGWLKETMQKQATRLSELALKASESEKTAPDRAALALDALIHMAYTLDDEKLKAAAQSGMERLISSQREDGWFGFDEGGDYLPRIIYMNAAYAYLGYTSDKRVLVFMDNFFRYEFRNLSSHPLEGTACAWAADNIYTALKVYNITGQKHLPELCKRLKDQMLDWTTIFSTFPNVQPMSKSMTLKRLNEGMNEEKHDLKGENHPFFASYYHQTRGVNVANGLKAPGVVSMFKTGFKELNGFQYGWEKLIKYHGTALGMFTCDEHLNGSDPSAGTNTAAVVEAMRSIETLLDAGSFGDKPVEVLEKLAFNALPAALDEKTGLCQSLQQTNQIDCSGEGHGWYNAPDGANEFTDDTATGGIIEVADAYGRFASCLWQATNDEGLSAVSYAPCSASHTIESVPVRLDVSGDYPFGENVEIAITAKRPIEFPLYLRIPSWAVNPMIHLPGGEIMSVRAGETACIRQKWTSDCTVRINLPRLPLVKRWSRQSASVEVGSLLMALPLEGKEALSTDENGIRRMDVRRGENDMYALNADESMKLVEAQQPGFEEIDGSTKLMAKICKTEWPLSGSDAGAIPILPECGKGGEITACLVPYGCTKLRISQFPIAKMEEKDA